MTRRSSERSVSMSTQLDVVTDGGYRFDSPQEEAAHYREKYRRILDMLDETRAELGEHV